MPVALRMAEASGTIQEAKTSEQQARSKAEFELKALQDSARLDFERIGALSEENTELKVGAGCWPLRKCLYSAMPAVNVHIHSKTCFKDCFMILWLDMSSLQRHGTVVLYRVYCRTSQQTLSLHCLQDQVEELKISREATASAELQELRSAQEAAQARLAQAEASISALTSEKDTFAKRCVARSGGQLPVSCLIC